MEAKIVKKIVIETRDIPDRAPYYREAVREQMMAYREALKDGEYPNLPVTMNEITYERMDLMNPETKLREHFYVNVNERRLWEQLVAVSDGFINNKIEEGVQRFRDQFLTWDLPKIERKHYERGIHAGANRFKALPWYKRLFFSSMYLTKSNARIVPKDI